MTTFGPSDVVLLPEGWDRVAKIAAEAGCAIGITQPSGGPTHISDGMRVWIIDVHGNDTSYNNPQQEPLC